MTATATPIAFLSRSRGFFGDPNGPYVRIGGRVFLAAPLLSRSPGGERESALLAVFADLERRHMAGESYFEIADAYCISHVTMRRLLHRIGLGRPMGWNKVNRKGEGAR